jgi:chitodextrinase
MQGGDTLILKDGTYPYASGNNQINPPSGSSGNYTIIRAENNFRAIISCNGYTWSNPVQIQGKRYIQLEGLKFENSTAYESCIYVDDSDHIKLMKISIHNGVGADDNSKYGCPVRIRDSNYCLVEDVFVSGRMRYGILVRSEYSSKVSHHIILRRCVVRWDFANTDQPMAGISIYGTDGATTIHDILLQNCIVLDWNPGNYGSKNSIYGGFYTPHVTKDVTYRDCIALNIHGTMSLTNYDQILAGFMVADDKALNGDRGMYNCVSWDTEGPGIWIERGDNMTTTLDQVTVGDADSNHREIRNAIYDKALGTSNLTNSLIYNNTYTDNTDNSDYNWYYPANHARGNNYITVNPNLKYIVRTTDTGTGQGGKKRGATIEKRLGVSGTLWGEAGYDTLTDEDLWPWPYEDQIKADFSQPNSSTSGCIPSTNDPKRGFCADETGLYGGPITLTSYIWEYLGNPIPQEIYGSAGFPTITITIPTNASTYSTTNSTVALGGTATGDVLVTNIIWSNSQGESGTAQGTTNWTISDISLQPGSNIITVTAQDSDGNTSTDTITVTYSIPDTESPSTPTNLQATSVSLSQINLSWSASTDNVGVSGYRIYRDGTQIGSTANITYQDAGLSPSTTYSYTVSAFDAAGNESGQSTASQATTTGDTTPPTITSVSAGTPNDTKVTITFSEPVEQASAETVSNYAINQGITVSATSLGVDLKTVTLTTSTLSEGITYTLTVNNVKDLASVPNTIASNTQKTFTFTSDLVAYWTMNSADISGVTLYDKSGNGNDGTINGATVTNGKSGDALSFDGTNDYVSISGLLGTPTNITLSAWARLDAADTNGAELISLGDYVAIRVDDSSGGTKGFYFDTTNNWRGVNTNVDYAGTGWHHFAYVVDDTNNSQKMYVDGIERASASWTNPIQYTTLGSNTEIGRHANGTGSYDFNGIIDDVRIYNQALSATEIQNVFNSQPPDQNPPSPPTGLIIQ